MCPWKIRVTWLCLGSQHFFFLNLHNASHDKLFFRSDTNLVTFHKRYLKTREAISGALCAWPASTQALPHSNSAQILLIMLKTHNVHGITRLHHFSVCKSHFAVLLIFLIKFHSLFTRMKPPQSIIHWQHRVSENVMGCDHWFFSWVTWLDFLLDENFLLFKFFHSLVQSVFARFIESTSDKNSNDQTVDSNDTSHDNCEKDGRMSDGWFTAWAAGKVHIYLG